MCEEREHFFPRNFAAMLSSPTQTTTIPGNAMQPGLTHWLAASQEAVLIENAKTSKKTVSTK